MKKNLLAIFIGFVFVVLAFLALEMLFRIKGGSQFVDRSYIFYNEHWSDYKLPQEVLPADFEKELRNNPFDSWQSALSQSDVPLIAEEGVAQDGFFICCLAQNNLPPPGKTHIRFQTKKTGKTIYSVDVTMDKIGRRRTPLSAKANKAILMYGDSYTLGAGVEDEETAPFILGKLRPNTQVYNMGLAGGSPNEFLFEVSRMPFHRTSDINHTKVTVIFTFMADHLERLFCRSLCLADERFWTLMKPYYADVDGRPVYRGEFRDRTFINSIYRGVEKSAFLHSLGVVIPPRFTQKHFDFFADVMLEAKAHVSLRYPEADFYVAFYPWFSRPFGDYLAKSCQSRGLKVLNYNNIDIYNLTKGRHEIVGDGHASPLTNYIFAKLLDRDLPK